LYYLQRNVKVVLSVLVIENIFNQNSSILVPRMRKTMAKILNRDTKSVNNDGDVKKRKKQAKAEAKLMLQIEQAKKDVEKSQQKIAKAERVLQERTTRLNELEKQLTQLQTNGKVSPHSAAEFATTDTSQAATKEAAQTPIAIGSDIHIEPDAGDSYEDNEDIITQHREEQEPAEGRTDITEPQQEPTEEHTNIPAAQQPPVEGGTTVTVAQQEPAEGRIDITEEPQQAPTEERTVIPAAQQPPVEGDTAVTIAQQEPAEGRNDITETEQQTTDTADTTSTTPEPAEASAIADLPKDEQVVSSGEGSIPIVTSDEHAWPPPHIREELAEGIVEQAKEDKEREQEKEKNS
jgi:hypothetical protein